MTAEHDIEREARELLAAEFRSNGWYEDAHSVSQGDGMEMYGPPLRAIAAALRKQQGAVVFTNDGSSEAQFVADGERLNCPRCGGSGHVADTTPPTDGDMARALDWVRALAAPCSAEEREALSAIEEALAAYDPERMARCGRTGEAQSA